MDCRVRRCLTGALVSLVVCFSLGGTRATWGGSPTLGRQPLATTVLGGGDRLIEMSQQVEQRVVRAYYTDRGMLDGVASWVEPWEVDPVEGCLVVAVDSSQYAWLLDQGFRVVVDQGRTLRLNGAAVGIVGQSDGVSGYPCYRTVEETFAAAEEIAFGYPQLATWVDIGDSWERVASGGARGHDIRVLRLTNAEIPGQKPALIVVAAMHARELASAELAMRFAEYLVTGYGHIPDVTWLLDYHEIHVLLQANPDGRQLAETGLLWRKNVNNDHCPGTTRRGVDLNRNFAFMWGCCGGSSGFECDEVYRGPFQGSEPETQAIQDYLRALFADQRDDDLISAAPVTATGVLLDLHSYGRLVLWPWGFTRAAAPNESALKMLGERLAFFNQYVPWQASDLYVTDGALDDFAYGTLGVASFTIELGTDFFQDCTAFETEIVSANLPALVYASRVARMPYLLPSGPEPLDITVSPSVVDDGLTARLTAIVDGTRRNSLDRGSEGYSPISAAEYYLDDPPWGTTVASSPFPMAAVDGGFDEPVEAVEAAIDAVGLTTGRHLVFVRGQDSEGNWGPISAGFLYVLPVSTYLPVCQTGP
ncbi:MAG: carboxypeptidase [Chloroflexi bacterium]|nr:carboxypeptidase [Chloroflexota bacterium]